jgi:hypothetical protein
MQHAPPGCKSTAGYAGPGEQDQSAGDAIGSGTDSVNAGDDTVSLGKVISIFAAVKGFLILVFGREK